MMETMRLCIGGISIDVVWRVLTRLVDLGREELVG